MFILCRGRDHDVIYKELLTCDWRYIVHSLEGLVHTFCIRVRAHVAGGYVQDQLDFLNNYAVLVHPLSRGRLTEI
jgi:hypothetical protein